MDLLAQRYASPFSMLDHFIAMGQLHEFTIEILKKIAKEREHDVRWQFFLHRVYDMSFEEYVESCEAQKEKEQTKTMTKEQVVHVVEDSRNILNGYVLE